MADTGPEVVEYSDEAAPTNEVTIKVNADTDPAITELDRVVDKVRELNQALERTVELTCKSIGKLEELDEV